MLHLHTERRESIPAGGREGPGHPGGWQGPHGHLGELAAISGGAAGEERDLGGAPGPACLHPSR